MASAVTCKLSRVFLIVSATIQVQLWDKNYQSRARVSYLHPRFSDKHG